MAYIGIFCDACCHKAVGINAHIQALTAVSQFRFTLLIQKKDASPVIAVHKAVLHKEIRPMLCQSQKVLPLIGGKDWRLQRGQL